MSLKNHSASGFRNARLWPSETQQLLLRAAVMEGDDAIHAWNAWRDKVATLENLDHPSCRLLPLVYQQLLAKKVSDELMEELSGRYLDAWMQLNRNLSYVLSVLKTFESHGIETLMLKGAPLAYEVYPMPATRPMADFDILVPIGNVRAAVELLRGLGWLPIRPILAADFKFRHSEGFVNQLGVEVDLHWHVSSSCMYASANTAFWSKSMNFTIAGVTTRQLDPTDTLVHVLVHGVAWASEPSIRWIVDAKFLLDHHGSAIEWRRVVEFSRQYQTSRRVLSGLLFLEHLLGVSLPKDILAELDAIPMSYVERIEMRERPPLDDKVDASNYLDQLAQFLRTIPSDIADKSWHGKLWFCFKTGLFGEQSVWRFIAHKYRAESIGGALKVVVRQQFRRLKRRK